MGKGRGRGLCLLVLLLTFASGVEGAKAEDLLSKPSWMDRVYLFAGGGFNGSVYTQSGRPQDEGLGLNFKTDLGYQISHHWSLEWGSSVKFNRLGEHLIWDTLLTVGTRYRFDEWSWPRVKDPYGRVFIGRSPVVVFLNGSPPPEYQNSGIDRLHFDGPIVGFALGSMNTSELTGRSWFTELAASAQFIQIEEGVNMDGEASRAVFSRPIENETIIYSLYFTVGILIF